MEHFSTFFLNGHKKTQELDDGIQTIIGALRCSIWVQLNVTRGHLGMGIMGRGVTGGDRGETAGDRERPGAQHYQQFLLIVQHVAGNH